MAEGRDWNDDERDEIRKFAETALQSITRLSNIVDRRQPSSSNSLSELQRRFPTTGPGRTTGRTTPAPNSASTRGRGTSRPTPYARRNAGRPHESSTVTKDVVVIEYGHDKVPTKSEKVALEQSRRIISGFEIHREWTSVPLEKELSSLLKGSQIEGYSFEIMKNCSGTLIKPTIPVGRRIDSKLLIKSIAPSGCVYIRLLAELPSDDEDDMLFSPFDSPQPTTPSSVSATSTNININRTNPVTVHVPSSILPSTSAGTSTATVDLTDAVKEPDADPVHTYQGHPVQCPFDVKSIINSAKSQNLVDPVEVLRFLQEHIVQGRKLDIVSTDEPCEGETNFINVDRDRALLTTFSELEFAKDYRLTFEVGFMGEDVADLGGPRREWIRLVNREIKEKYFDQGLRQYLSSDYFYVGIMMAIAMLQNGQMPAFIQEEILNEILTSSQSSNHCIVEIQAGLEMLGMLSALQQLPMLHYLLRPNSQHPITGTKLLELLKPQYSEQGSNSLKYEKEVYQHFVRFVREVATGLRSCGNEKLDLSHILSFVTGSAEEPVLGFALDPSIEFVKKDVSSGFAPTAHTCGNILSIPVPSSNNPLPTQQKLFAIYDLAFSQSYFGKL